MKSLATLYCETVREELGGGYRATWLPGNRVDIGTVGTVQNNVFVPAGTICDGNGNPPRTVEVSREGIFNFVSARGVTFAPKIAGEAPVEGSLLSKASAGIRMLFQRRGATVLAASGCTERRVVDLKALGQELLRRSRDGQWNHDWYVVVSTVEADALSVFIGANDSGCFEAECGVGVGAAAPSPIALVDAGLKVIRDSGFGLSLRHFERTTPFCHLACLVGRTEDSAMAQVKHLADVPPDAAPEAMNWMLEVDFEPQRIPLD